MRAVGGMGDPGDCFPPPTPPRMGPWANHGTPEETAPLPHPSSMHPGLSIYLHYDGYGPAFDEWLSVEDAKLVAKHLQHPDAVDQSEVKVVAPLAADVAKFSLAPKHQDTWYRLKRGEECICAKERYIVVTRRGPK